MTCGSPSRWHVSRAAITASGEQHARSALGPAGSSQSRSVTPIAFGAARSSATALSTPPLIATAMRPAAGAAANDRGDRVRKRIRGERLARHGGRLEQREADERPLETRRVGLDDDVVLDDQPHGGVVLAARGVADQFEQRHAVRLAGGSTTGWRRDSRTRSRRGSVSH